MEQEKHFAMTFKGTSVADLKQNPDTEKSKKIDDK